jgi:hypothetical protein
MEIWFGVLFILIGVFFGIFIGGHMGVDSCTKDIEENVKFRHMLEIIIKTKNNKKLKENERKRMIYEQIDFLNQYMNGEVNLHETRN